MSDSREKFENEFKNPDRRFVIFSKEANGYVTKESWLATQVMLQNARWAAWQACEASREFVVELPIPVHRMGFSFNYGTSYIDCLSKDQVIAAIEKAGGRVK